ncbi:MAG TPA: serine/threonine-protein kinase [Burkholderiales bacterium]|jgi:serine/threonine protein kinase|nr:serine/threonine-protein kinase [Burkholderiales bacterium]HSA72061.1 serine/threonine-protein kinase [Burkholderiales bacterium]
MTSEQQAVPGYTVVHIIGQGGQAQVFLAEREHDGLRVALKVLNRKLRNDPVFLERFVREYKLVASLNSNYVARIYDQGFSGDFPYIAMEFLPSGTLAARIREGLTARAALRIASQIAQALDTIHSHGIVHRDLKPANILFRADGRPVIVDFGLARDMRINSTLTVAGQFLATPRYMSPEQCLGNSVDARSDLYSLGAMLYEMMTGNKIYDHAHSADVIAMHVHAPVPQLTGMLSVHQPLLDRLLAKNPEDRFQSAAEVIAEIGL